MKPWAIDENNYYYDSHYEPDLVSTVDSIFSPITGITNKWFTHLYTTGVCNGTTYLLPLVTNKLLKCLITSLLLF